MPLNVPSRSRNQVEINMTRMLANRRNAHFLSAEWRWNVDWCLSNSNEHQNSRHLHTLYVLSSPTVLLFPLPCVPLSVLDANTAAVFLASDANMAAVFFWQVTLTPFCFMPTPLFFWHSAQCTLSSHSHVLFSMLTGGRHRFSFHHATR